MASLPGQISKVGKLQAPEHTHRVPFSVFRGVWYSIVAKGVYLESGRFKSVRPWAGLHQLLGAGC